MTSPSVNPGHSLHFTKMHGIGNDYVYINTLSEAVEDPAALAVRVSDRHFGIGSDGLVLIAPSAVADFMMDMYNSDGSRGKMCGNAIRCVAKYVYDRGLTSKTTLTIETLSGVKNLQLQVDNGQVSQVTVNMGAPVFHPAEIPVRWEGTQMVNEPVNIGGQTVCLTAVSMGNPHAVTFMDEVESLDLAKIGPAFEHHPLFPDRVNTEFVQVIDRQNLRMRVWERGSGETMACGTGSCATLAAAVVNGLADRRATVRLNGGDLLIEWDETSNHIFMTGPAAFVFDGQIVL